jgi:hypothetical protein
METEATIEINCNPESDFFEQHLEPVTEGE